MKKAILTCIIGLLFGNAWAQSNNLLIDEGNKLYDNKKFDAAAAIYQQALKKDPKNIASLFNLSNTLYQQKKIRLIS